jgi:hypothetical protein
MLFISPSLRNKIFRLAIKIMTSFALTICFVVAAAFWGHAGMIMTTVEYWLHSQSVSFSY